MVAGLRWGPNVMPHDYFNRGVEFNRPTFLANTISTVYPNAPAGALYYGDKGVTEAVHQELVAAVLSQLRRVVRSRRATARRCSARAAR